MTGAIKAATCAGGLKAALCVIAVISQETSESRPVRKQLCC